MNHSKKEHEIFFLQYLVWIRFPGHNFYFYDESILLALSFAVGSPVKVDVKALDARRGSFSRVCVEVELKKLVVGRGSFLVGVVANEIC